MIIDSIYEGKDLNEIYDYYVLSTGFQRLAFKASIDLSLQQFIDWVTENQPDVVIEALEEDCEFSDTPYRIKLSGHWIASIKIIKNIPDPRYIKIQDIAGTRYAEYCHRSNTVTLDGNFSGEELQQIAEIMQ